MEMLSSELSTLRSHVTALLTGSTGSSSPVGVAAQAWAQRRSLLSNPRHWHTIQQARAQVVLLMSRATNGSGPGWDERLTALENSETYTRPPQVNVKTQDPSWVPILPSQQRLAQIVEMIHVASILHNRITDLPPPPEGTEPDPTKEVNVGIYNKVAILGGDFLLGRTSVMLASLRDPEVVELIATVIANMGEGGVRQMVSAPSPDVLPNPLEEDGADRLTPNVLPVPAIMASLGISSAAPITSRPSIESRMHTALARAYLRTGSLLAKSARAATVLGGFGGRDDNPGSTEMASRTREAAYDFGAHLGMAIQLTDDALRVQERMGRFIQSGLAKASVWSRFFASPAPSRLSLGEAEPFRLALAEGGYASVAALLAADESGPEVRAALERALSQDGDVQVVGSSQRCNALRAHTNLLSQLLSALSSTPALGRMADLARSHASRARTVLSELPESEARDALDRLAAKSVQALDKLAAGPGKSVPLATAAAHPAQA